ncbi:MAG TPA: HigA family addiction module antitoxin [Usitatibacter sp.]|jgi:addiction module HigA family antidote|nr:HigA family addiction module antitoxin [Usitatibacter sp.]
MPLRRRDPPEHPGVALREYMETYEISQNALARAMRVSPRRINEIVNGKRSITAETALGLGALIGPSAQHWMVLQVEYDLERCRKQRQKRRGGPYGPLPPVGDSVPFDGDEFIREGWDPLQFPV